MDTAEAFDQPACEGESADLILAHSDVVAHAEALGRLHPLFAGLLARNGPPPLWRRHPSFQTLVRLVLEQQVSLASANAAFRRLEARVGNVTPSSVLESTDAQLKGDGFSRQKAGYVRGIAHLILDGDFEPETMPADATVSKQALMSIRGIGPWTAACFLVFALGLPDEWPRGDRALHVSMAQVMHLPSIPGSDDAESIASSWTPHRSTAARMLWHDYLGGASYVQAHDAGFL